jgi:hypothetical protein
MLYASFAKTWTRRSARTPVATWRSERRDHSLAHSASGRTEKVPAGTGGKLRGLRLLDDLCI